MSHPIHFVDVFAEERLAGNPVAVVLDAETLSTKMMQAIARETNLSETTFVCGREPEPEGHRVRIFTPTAELPFALELAERKPARVASNALTRAEPDLVLDKLL